MVCENVSFAPMSQNEAVTSVHGVVSQGSTHKDQHVGDVSIS